MSDTTLPPGWRINTFVDGYQANNGKNGSARQVTWISHDYDAVVREAIRLVWLAKTRVRVAPAPSKSQLSIFDVIPNDVPDDLPF